MKGRKHTPEQNRAQAAGSRPVRISLIMPTSGLCRLARKRGRARTGGRSYDVGIITGSRGMRAARLERDSDRA